MIAERRSCTKESVRGKKARPTPDVQVHPVRYDFHCRVQPKRQREEIKGEILRDDIAFEEIIVLGGTADIDAILGSQRIFVEKVFHHGADLVWLVVFHIPKAVVDDYVNERLHVVLDAVGFLWILEECGRHESPSALRK